VQVSLVFLGTWKEVVTADFSFSQLEKMF